MNLQIAARQRLGRITLDVSFSADVGLTALVGPSGAGKTSVLDTIAGLLRPEDGRVVLGGRVLFDTASAVWVPPERRHVGYMRQEPLLFPHLSVRQNLLYG